MQEDIYFNCVLTKKINIEPKFLNNNIDNYILEYFKKNIEGKCIAEGYVKEDTISVLKKSVGRLYGSRFTGDIKYEIIYTADICNPVIGNIIECKVKFINKLGILGYNGPITIVVRKQFNEFDNYFDKINQNDVIKVEVIAKKYHLNDKEIKVVTKLYNENEEVELKQGKKEIIQSDLTSFDNMADDLLDINEDYNKKNDDEEDEEEYDADDIDDLDEEKYYDEDGIEDEAEDIEVKNPDENNVDDIELDDSEDESDIISNEDDNTSEYD
jgi:DNA-directed RNA polymerase subunit E'/Rpb7